MTKIVRFKKHPYTTPWLPRFPANKQDKTKSFPRIQPENDIIPGRARGKKNARRQKKNHTVSKTTKIIGGSTHLETELDHEGGRSWRIRETGVYMVGDIILWVDVGGCNRGFLHRGSRG